MLAYVKQSQLFVVLVPCPTCPTGVHHVPVIALPGEPDAPGTIEVASANVRSTCSCPLEGQDWLAVEYRAEDVAAAEVANAA